MTKDINNVRIEKGHIVRHIYKEIGYENNVHEREELIIIESDPENYFTIATISVEIVGETIERIAETGVIRSNIIMEDMHGRELTRGDVVRIYSSKTDVPYGSNYTHHTDYIVLNIGQFYLDSLQYFDKFEIVSNEYE